MSEEFLLKWNDHHNLFFLGAEELCETEEYTDVTLAAGTKFFPAHKLVLSICSPYFKHLFKHLGKDKPVIFLKDVDPRHLDLLLQYMYKGEIRVEESELVNVLSTAQALDIRGLSDKSGPSSSKVPSVNKSLKRPPPPPPPLSIIPGFEENAQKKQKTALTTSNQMSVKRNSIEDSSQNLPKHATSKPEAVTVKQELSQVTVVDLEQEEDPCVAYAGGTQEGVFGDTSIVAEYEREGAFGDADYYDDSIGDQETQDDRVPAMPSGLLAVCPYCNKQFTGPAALKDHMLFRVCLT